MLGRNDWVSDRSALSEDLGPIACFAIEGAARLQVSVRKW
jgi:hypothetical protein